MRAGQEMPQTTALLFRTFAGIYFQIAWSVQHMTEYTDLLML
jgi:hypothetical protein